ncbi:MAG: molybdopterin molybdotransferase MoeA [Bacteroidota bacterium]
MITPQEATQIINSHLIRFANETVGLDQARGRILQEAVVADRDFPPFNRVMMDGIAYSLERVSGENPKMAVEGLHLAGEPAKTLAQTNNCLEVMTGAVLPAGVDTVSPYEEVDIREENGEKVAILKTIPERKGKNIHPQGYDRSRGEELLSAGTRLGAAQIAVAASVGKSELLVAQPPKVAIVSTGDELVSVSEQPEPYQIRRSNNYALRTALAKVQVSSSFYHLPDSLEKTTAGLAEVLENHPVVILSGGVSKGKRDYVPVALEQLGVKKLFHRVKQRPGKPFWFGVKGNQNVVFALPGNPVSTFMCFHRYVQPWLEKNLGVAATTTQWAALSENVKFEPELTYFLTVMAQSDENGQLLAKPIQGHGSGDFANLLHCNGFLELPADRSHFRQGEAFPFIPFA